MLERCKSARERWGGVSQIIDRWLHERQELISRYCQLTITDFRQESPTAIAQRVASFCEVMMDYICAGHFEVYEQLFEEGSEFADGSVSQVQNIPLLLQQNTQLFLNFNDRYDTSESCINLLQKLPDELSDLGEIMEERFRLEDKLIAELHESHRLEAASLAENAMA